MGRDYGVVTKERIIEKNGHEQFRIQRRESQKHGNFVDTRLWYTDGEVEKTADGGEEFIFKPGSGIRPSAKLAPKIAAAMLELGDAPEETEEEGS